MTKEETARILSRLKANQNSFMINMDVSRLWEQEFAGESFKDVHAAVTKFIRTNTENYPVSVAKIRALLPAKQKGGSLTTRAYDIVYDEQGRRILRKIIYHIEHGDMIVDEQGRTYSHPDETIHAMLVSRVKSTGMILSDTEAEAERSALIAKL